jgi:predicted Rossmann fold flavoprotein
VGSAVDISVECNGQSFREALLFTHRGISGPAILQISSYWQPGDAITINWLPNLQLSDYLQQMKRERPKTELRTILAELLTKKWAQVFCEDWITSKPLNQFSGQELQKIADRLHGWQITPAATEGYRTAEVTLGGVDVNGLSSKTMEAKTQPGLYFIGEVVDVTGWLGGFNFQWAWASGYAAGEVV